MFYANLILFVKRWKALPWRIFLNQKQITVISLLFFRSVYLWWRKLSFILKFEVNHSDPDWWVIFYLLSFGVYFDKTLNYTLSVTLEGIRRGTWERVFETINVVWFVLVKLFRRQMFSHCFEQFPETAKKKLTLENRPIIANWFWTYVVS